MKEIMEKFWEDFDKQCLKLKTEDITYELSVLIQEAKDRYYRIINEY